ncbi:hypothetical protein ACJJIF_01325 [Microbulbifer sp. SSSA002]|uniref:hypothetical protein n=1 Tax=Microbulbifer sp. SSSA002 TaxID=3243376 RepID=UPI004039472A
MSSYHYFYEKACKELADLNEQYGETHRIAVMLSRMFGEILLPGASSNVLSPLAQEQDPENGVDKAFFGK